MTRTAFPVIAVLAAGLIAGPAAADTWTAAYSGTIVATYADGHLVKVFVEPDHTFSIVPASGEALRGTWQDAGGQSCSPSRRPQPPPAARPAASRSRSTRREMASTGRMRSAPTTA